MVAAPIRKSSENTNVTTKWMMFCTTSFIRPPRNQP
jgi:hypothetical protein